MGVTVRSDGTRADAVRDAVFWRVEGSLAYLTAVRPIGFFTWNAHTFAERWARRGGLFLETLVRPALYASHRVFATRVLHALLRGISRDRLDLLGEEYFEYVLKPQLKTDGVEKLRQALARGQRVVLVSQGLDHVMRPLARHLGVAELVANRLEFRGGVATGRLLEPVIRPRGGLALVLGGSSDGQIGTGHLLHDLGLSKEPQKFFDAIMPAARLAPQNHRSLVLFDRTEPTTELSVRKSLAGKQILLIGVTGFIGKVWLEQILHDVPEIGRIYVLVRRQKGTTPQRRFERILEESPVFDRLEARYGGDLGRFLAERVEVVGGDASEPGLGMEPEVQGKLAASLDVIVNSAGLTDFNPDLRDALAGNVRSAAELAAFLRRTDHAALLHLSTCYVVGGRDGRVSEEAEANYTPARVEDFDAEREWQSLEEMIRKVEERVCSPEVEAALKRQALGRKRQGDNPPGNEINNLIRKNRARWIKNRVTRAGTRRARHLGWPNTYTFTKSLGESLLLTRGKGLPIAIVRPSIVETSTGEPFRGWNEGINTSAPLSYLLGTYFRQLPSNRRKCLDLIPVDMVGRGMTLIAAALVTRRHKPIYQLATSGQNPCDMGRSIELTALAHRKHYRAQQGMEHWLRTRFDTIPVSKERYATLSVPAQKIVVQGINRAATALQFKRPPLARAERDLERVEKLIHLYEPFILHNEQIFEADHVQLLSACLPEDEREPFGYEPGMIDWWDYWINIHIPALRRWCYPLIEGHPIEARERRDLNPPNPTEYQAETRAANAQSSQATWRSS